MNKNFKLLTVFIFLFSFLILPNFVKAVECLAMDANGNCTKVAGFLDNIKNTACMASGDCTLTDIAGGFIELTKWLIGAIGALALLYFVWGGVQWLTSYGNQQKIQKGREIMLQTVIALAVAFMSYILVSFFVNNVLQAKPEVRVNTNTQYDEPNIVPSSMHCCFNINANPQCQSQLTCPENFNDLGTENCLNYTLCIPILPE